MKKIKFKFMLIAFALVSLTACANNSKEMTIDYTLYSMASVIQEIEMQPKIDYSVSLETSEDLIKHTPLTAESIIEENHLSIKSFQKEQIWYARIHTKSNILPIYEVIEIKTKENYGVIVLKQVGETTFDFTNGDEFVYNELVFGLSEHISRIEIEIID